MSKRSPTSLEVKLHVVERCLQNETNPTYEAKRIGVDRHTVTKWIRKYKADGFEGLKKSRGWKAYSEDLRLTAIMDVLSGKHSIREATKKYHISSKSVLTRWISKYTSREAMEPTRKGKGLSRMNKGRKTTLEERIEIAQYTIAHDLDYQKSVEKYKVSYQQVYAWVRKFQSGGEDALSDKRGRNKPEEARNEYLEMEKPLQKSWQRSGDEIHTNLSSTCRLVSSHPIMCALGLKAVIHRKRAELRESL